MKKFLTLVFVFSALFSSQVFTKELQKVNISNETGEPIELEFSICSVQEPFNCGPTQHLNIPEDEMVAVDLKNNDLQNQDKSLIVGEVFLAKMSNDFSGEACNNTEGSLVFNVINDKIVCKKTEDLGPSPQKTFY